MTFSKPPITHAITVALCCGWLLPAACSTPLQQPLGAEPTDESEVDRSSPAADSGESERAGSLAFSPIRVVNHQGRALVVGAGATDPSVDSSLPPTVANDFLVARFTPQGALDREFGQGGYAAVDFSTVMQSKGEQDLPMAVAVAPDDKIVLAGYGASSAFGALGAVPALARLLPDGTLDPSFGREGRVLHQPSNLRRGDGEVSFRALALDDQGRIYVVGDKKYGSAWLLRFDANGEHDSSFMDGDTPIDPEVDTPIGLFVNESRILVVGNTFAVAAFKHDGTLDTSFGGDGYFRGGGGFAHAVAQQPDGTFLVVGSNTADDADDSVTTLKVLAVDPNGEPAAFGTEGVVEVDVGISVMAVQGVHASSDGGLLLYYTSLGQPGLLRVGPGGAVDPSFGDSYRGQLDYRAALVPSDFVRGDLLEVIDATLWIADFDTTAASGRPVIAHGPLEL